jgi:hypothetical protein
MKRKVILTIFILSLVMLVLSPAMAKNNLAADWFFVVVETRVHEDKPVEAGDEPPEERRWYISSVVALPENIPDYSAQKKVGEYFDANVVEPAKKAGVVIEYFDQELQINGGSVIRVDSRAEAEEMRNKDLADRKEQGGNIYSFNISFGPSKGEETSQPRLLFRDKKQPNYAGSKKP